MKKKGFSLIVGFFMLFTISSVAFGAQGPYVSGNLGATMLRDSRISDPTASVELEFDAGWGAGVAVGYTFENCRIEGEIGYQKNDVSKIGAGATASGDETNTSFMVNGYYDFMHYGAFTPYITAGVGIAILEINDLSIPILGTSGSNDDAVAAFQVGAGVGYAVTERIALDLKYRYFGTNNPDFGTVDSEYGSHNFSLGVRYNF